MAIISTPNPSSPKTESTFTTSNRALISGMLSSATRFYAVEAANSLTKDPSSTLKLIESFNLLAYVRDTVTEENALNAYRTLATFINAKLQIPELDRAAEVGRGIHEEQSIKAYNYVIGEITNVLTSVKHMEPRANMNTHDSYVNYLRESALFQPQMPFGPNMSNHYQPHIRPQPFQGPHGFFDPNNLAATHENMKTLIWQFGELSAKVTALETRLMNTLATKA